MAISNNHGNPKVAGGGRPGGGKSGGATKGSPNVANAKGKIAQVSVGKMPDSAGGVQLGTTHGKHNVAHRLSSSSGGSIQKH